MSSRTGSESGVSRAVGAHAAGPRRNDLDLPHTFGEWKLPIGRKDVKKNRSFVLRMPYLEPIGSRANECVADYCG